MKKLKRILAVLMTMAMVLGMTVTASAEAGVTPSEKDKQTASVQNVEKGATVTAYRIIEPEYDNGFKGYAVVSDVADYLTGVDMATSDEDNPAKPKQSPTAEQIQAVARAISNGDVTVSKIATLLPADPDADVTTYSAELEAGYWVVIIGSTGETIYNPMLLGVYYTKADGTAIQMNGGVIDATTSWNLYGDTGYAKSNKPTIDKKIVDATGKPVESTTDEGNTNNGADVAAGDTVYFEVDTIIPAYSDSFETVEYKISDKLSAGLKSNRDVAVTVEGAVMPEDVEEPYTPYTITYTDDQNMEIVFDSAYALANAGKTVKVIYSATLQENAGQNFDKNSNTAKLTYTNDPSDSSKTTEIEDKTYTYTFEIDGNLNGQGSETTEELKKVDADKWEPINGTKTYKTPLAGAEFDLKNAAGEVVGHAISDNNGRISFKGLDAGSYTLVETKAPDGYSINKEEIPVVISATYNEDGTLASYTITIADDVTSTYNATYEADDVEIKKTTENTYNFLNTKLANLPSTGGIGTYIFTIAGIIIMAAAAGFFFVSRRKAEK